MDHVVELRKIALHLARKLRDFAGGICGFIDDRAIVSEARGDGLEILNDARHARDVLVSQQIADGGHRFAGA